MVGIDGWVRWSAFTALALCGCARGPVAGETECEEVSPGDIVITEVHANPDGSDGDSEYIELFNPRAAAVELEGWTLVSSRADGTGASEHRFGKREVGSDEYIVLGAAPHESLPEHIDYSYGDTLGSLRNSNAALSIRCGEMVIDDVAYASSRDGRALELDGSLTPDAESNDNAMHWCFAPETATEVSPGNFGTPGTANSMCGEPNVADTCREQGKWRSLDRPVPGGVRITEWMANPDGQDSEFEWVEVSFTEPADLNGFRLGTQSDALGAPFVNDECFPVDAGSQVVFGASPAAAARVDAELGFSLGNTGDRSIVAAIDDTILDRVDYIGAEEGVAWQVDSDELLCLVDAVVDYEYRVDNFGTPGAPNPTCTPVLGPGMCLDENTPRPIRSPLSTQVQITEWMANPSMVGNRNGEWVEVRFDTDVDLNGLAWSDLSGASTGLEQDECASVPAGAYVVFARNLHEDENGGLPFVDAELDILLNNTSELISISIDGRALDSISYESSRSGVATQIDPWGFVCDASTAYGDGDLGTPGMPNPPCP